VGTAILMGVIFAISDARNVPPPRAWRRSSSACSSWHRRAFGFNSGYAINPARDFGPRLFTLIAGWGSEVFRAGNSWWWIPLVAPPIGAVLGGWIYDLFVGRRFPSTALPTTPRPEEAGPTAAAQPGQLPPA
jgi:glycerol uptake facilitator-like aquaporin